VSEYGSEADARSDHKQHGGAMSEESENRSGAETRRIMKHNDEVVSEADARRIMDTDPSGLHGRPTAAELIESVREWMERDVMTQTSGRLQFHTRVAINVLAMVERELALGPDQLIGHATRLGALGVATDTELANAIRNGDFDQRDAELRSALSDMARDQLRVANPKHIVD
jgi:hypothetical protein